MNWFKRAVPAGMAVVMAMAAPAAAFAGSPEFARTAEEWAKLRDNVIEYGELADLVQEYNVTVQTNRLELKKFKDEYGTTKDDVSQKYRDLANEIYANLTYPETDDPTYGYMVGSVLSAEVMAKNLEKQADDNLEDSEIIALNYENAEKTLVTVAQNNMIAYANSQAQVQQAQIAQKQAQQAYASAQVSFANGLATQVELLNAQEALQTAERNVVSAQAAVENARQKLQVMLGWKHSDTPQIEAVPAADMGRIAGMDPTADKAKALENNYTLRVNKKKLANAENSKTKESLEKTIADNERKIGSALVTAYQNVLTAKLSYEQAAADLALANQNFQKAAVEHAQGMVSANDFAKQQYDVQTKELALQLADRNLFQAMEAYDWAVNGLASAS